MSKNERSCLDSSLWRKASVQFSAFNGLKVSTVGTKT